MRRLVATSTLLLILAAPVLAQGNRPGRRSVEGVRYEPLGTDLFPGFEKAALILDYYFSSGISLGDRYSYEIIVTDRTLRLAFRSPGTESYKKVTFETKRELTVEEARALERVVATARLVQLREGVPRPTYSGHTREVLIVRANGRQIGGGMCNSNIFEDSTRDIDATIKRERAESSSIGGDYDSVIRALRDLFPELKGLLSQAEGGR